MATLTTPATTTDTSPGPAVVVVFTVLTGGASLASGGTGWEEVKLFLFGANRVDGASASRYLLPSASHSYSRS
jgi:hypothetical protein